MAKIKGPSQTTPKHGKKPENRMYSAFRRGSPSKQRDGDGGINPDSTIEVAAVCGSVVTLYDKVRGGSRRRLDRFALSNHGAAVLFATEHDADQRASRARLQG